MANITQTADKAPQRSRKVMGITFQPGRLVLYAILILGAVVAIVPFFWMVSTSLMTLGETITRQWVPKVPQFENFVIAWEEARFAKYFLNSVKITATTIVGLLTTSILAGYAFGRIKFFGRDIIFALLLAKMMIPESVTMIPNLLMIRGDILRTILPESKFTWMNTIWAMTVPFWANVFSTGP